MSKSIDWNDTISSQYYNDELPIWKQKVVDEFQRLLKKFLTEDMDDVSMCLWDCEITLKAPGETDAQ
jgi:hypothetical protein